MPDDMGSETQRPGLLRLPGFQQPLSPLKGSWKIPGKVPGSGRGTLFPQVKDSCKQFLRCALPPSGHSGHFMLTSAIP